MIYCHMRSEIIQIIACNNYDGFYILVSYFHENLFHYLKFI
jgi:hypothetical protein